MYSTSRQGKESDQVSVIAADEDRRLQVDKRQESCSFKRQQERKGN